MAVNRRLRLIFTSSLLCTYQLGFAAGPDTANGKRLYEGACFTCHDSSIHTRKNSIIDSLSALSKRVRFCENQRGAGWNEQHINDVIAYLNEAFYKFKQ